MSYELHLRELIEKIKSHERKLKEFYPPDRVDFIMSFLLFVCGVAIGYLVATWIHQN